ncbi:MAG TPA: L-serine ammonia-lyase, iron-sulfur-dependent, subunit alpha [Planctomycetota bacterium]|nr:L-serine ammonia-lyase, iron-sulfur-dependent, subunit alpha [Planctomycetota bacterium]
MESLRELYRIGAGPSSSHTMGPQRAAIAFKARHPAAAYRVTLYGSLGATGRGHLTDVALERALEPSQLELVWKPDVVLPFHPNGMDFEVPGTGVRWRVFSVGGGALREEGVPKPPSVYAVSSMEEILRWCDAEGEPVWRLAETSEGSGLWDHLADVWKAMQEASRRGLEAEGALPGGLKLRRKAREMRLKARASGPARATGLLSAYALAVMEENGSAGVVVTAPTCGACGAVPAVLKHVQETTGCGDRDVLHALGTAGIIGNLVKANASISGAEVGCQGEVGTACAMAAAAAAQLMGGSPRQIEYAAEMGMEHHLGLTCDPVMGLVQIPCIERNAFAATRAVSCAEYALLGDGTHRVTFDQVVRTMRETGRSLPSAFRETSEGGLASVLRAASHPM